MDGKVALSIGITLLLIGALFSVFPFVQMPKEVSETYQVTKAAVIEDHFGPWSSAINPSPIPPWSWTNNFLAFYEGELLGIVINVTSMHQINFTVYDGSTTYLSFQNAALINTTWSVPTNSSYNFDFRSSQAFSLRDIHWQIFKLWNETDYRSVTQKVPLLPFQALYVGLGTVLSGILIMVSWHRHRKTSQLKG